MLRILDHLPPWSGDTTRRVLQLLRDPDFEETALAVIIDTAPKSELRRLAGEPELRAAALRALSEIEREEEDAPSAEAILSTEPPAAE